MKLSYLALICASALALTACKSESPQSRATTTTPTPTAAISFPCLNPPSVSYATPGDTPITSQDGVNCFAWQTFIGLNWQVAAGKPGEPDTTISAAQFGQPGSKQTTVWETYANSRAVFRPNAATPLPWGQQAELPASCQLPAGYQARVMHANRISRGINLSSDASQAFPSTNPNWLADKQGNLVYYEILMGRDQYDYIVKNNLYDADQQAQHILQKLNIASPLGHDKVQGGLEIKAAWLSVSDPANPKWKRYKVTQAVVYDPDSGVCKTQTMALVGLHIIHKTASQPQWIWATFEHQDNVPDTAAIRSNGLVDGDYTFYANECSIRKVPAACKPKLVNKAPVTETSCQSNVSPAYYLSQDQQCQPYPIRVSRDFAIRDTTDNHVASLNRAVQQMIRQANPDSVFANYVLVNVLWSSAAVNDNEPPGKPPLTPLSISGETPSRSALPVANTMLESYAQGFNCLSCHAYASVAPAAKKQLNNQSYATDYSFLFGMASTKK